jgi:hypothetical protein
MTEPQQKRPVVFAGENPILQLHQAGGEQRVAAASVWRSTYSEQGVGYVLILWADPATSGLGAAAPSGIYTDNAELARLVWDRFNRHFDSFQNQGLEDAEPRPARFVEEAGGRRFHRITCSAGTTVIELVWRDLQDVFHNTGGATLGGTDWEITNVVCPTADGEIVVDGQAVTGEVRQTGGTFQSSAFLAFCESWVRR